MDKIKGIGLLLSCIVMFLCLTMAGNAEELHGNCSENITYRVTAEGVLMLEGVGEIPDYGWRDEKPWEAVQQEIVKVVIGEGITSVGEYALANLPSVK